MATSNAMSTSNQYVKYKITVTQNSQNIAGNKSNVTVSVRFYRTNTGYTTYGTGTVYCKINGTTYEAAVTPSQKITNSGIVLFTKTLDIPHNDNGTKSLTCSAWISMNTPLTSSEQSYTQTLTTIPRASTLSVGNGTLGVAQTLTVTRATSSSTHTITATCGSVTTTICTKSSSTSISFTPPMDWANQNTSGVSLSVKYTIETFVGSTSVSKTTQTKTCTMPASVVPSCSLTLTDTYGHVERYGGYIKGQSRITITVNATTAYGSSIVSYSTSVNGATSGSESFTTGILKNAGDQTITSTVTDKRGRKGTTSVSINVLDYAPPNISKLHVKRCTEDGTEDDRGEYIKVTISANVISLTGKNEPIYRLQYKKSSDIDWADADVSELNNWTTVQNYTYIFPADGGSSYEVMFVATDNFERVVRTTVVSTAMTIMHFKANGRGMSVGKVSEMDDVFDVGWKARLNAGMIYPVLQNGTDFNTLMTAGFFTIKSIQASSYANCPSISGTATLIVESCGEEGQVRQRVHICSKTAPIIYERYYYQEAWGEWIRVSDFGGKILWSGAYYMQASHKLALSEKISQQPSGIVLIFSSYTQSSGSVNDWHFNTHFVPKKQISMHEGGGHSFMLTNDATFDTIACKYLLIFDDRVEGHENNVKVGTSGSGITYNNKAYVLRYVIGV